MATKTPTSEKISHSARPGLTPSARSDWHKSAPRKIIVADDWSSGSAGWGAWRHHLAQRKSPRPLWRLLDDEQSPLLWCAPLTASEQSTAELVQWVDRLARGRSRPPKTLAAQIEAWLHGAADHLLDVGEALQALAWVHALPAIAGRLEADAWWRLWEHLVNLSVSAEGLELNGNPLLHQLVAGELPLALAYTFPELVACRRLLKPAGVALQLGVDELLDDQGIPSGEHVGQFRALLACWTRSAAMAEQVAGKPRPEHSGERYRRAVRQALRLTRFDGNQVLARGGAGEFAAGLFEAMLAASGSRKTRRLAAAALRPKLRRAIPSTQQVGKAPNINPAAHSPTARLGVLRAGWRPTDELLAVNYAGARTEIELTVAGHLFLTGIWGLEVAIDGQLARPIGPWTQLRFGSEDDVDHLELEVELAGDVRVRRHMVLSREDHLLLLADAIHAPQSCRIECASALPLAQQARFTAAGETREGFIKASKCRALALPLALPEWRRDPRGGRLAEVGRQLELRQETVASNLYVPLLLNLDQRRNRQPLTWRQLHVGEQLTNQPADVAVGYRAQVGRRQWLLYRSLIHKGSRTVLGVNLISEFLLARFSSEGTTENLLEVD